MRLTLELIQSAPQSINPTKDRMISLRGYKIAAIENLGATQDHYDCIDLSDNDILKIGNIPPLKRLKTLIMCNNRVTRIAEDFADCLKEITAVVLSQNKLEKLCDLEPLTKSKKLERLSLLDNPVSRSEHYRHYLIHFIPSLRFLDFQRVTDKERKDAAKLFAGEAGAKLKKEIAAPRAGGAAVHVSDDVMMGGAGGAVPQGGLLPDEVEKIKKAIEAATTIEEVTKLEKALKSGVLPPELQ